MSLTRRSEQDLTSIRRAHEALYKQEVRKVMSLKNDHTIWPASPCLIGRVLFKVVYTSYTLPHKHTIEYSPVITQSFTRRDSGTRGRQKDGINRSQCGYIDYA